MIKLPLNVFPFMFRLLRAEHVDLCNLGTRLVQLELINEVDNSAFVSCK